MEPKMPVNCPVCNREFKNARAIIAHRTQRQRCSPKYNSNLEPKQCSQCLQFFKGKKALHIHYTVTPNCKPPEPKPEPITFEKLNLDPAWCNWFAGFVDGEGCFSILCSDTKYKRFNLMLQISIRIDDKPVIQDILDKLKVGSTMIRDSPAIWRGCRMAQVRWKISHLRDILNVVIPLFEKYPLRTKKAKEFELWRQAAFILKQNRWRPNRDLVEVEKLREQIMFIHRPYNHSALDPKTASLQIAPNLRV
jgi:hypothetical protein